MQIAIIDRGRGPEIAGTRITVYDIVGRALFGALVPRIGSGFGGLATGAEIAQRIRSTRQVSS